MDIDFSPEDLAFQREVRAWFETHTPPDLKRKTVTGEMLQKDDIVQWQRRLDTQGWLVTGWPKEHGGPGWTVFPCDAALLFLARRHDLRRQRRGAEKCVGQDAAGRRALRGEGTP